MPRSVFHLRCKRTLFFLLLSSVSNYSFAQRKMYLKGAVITADNKSLADVSLSLYRMDSTFVEGVVSNAKGYYQFTHLDSGFYFMKASAIGFEKYKSNGIAVNRRTSLSPVIIVLHRTARELGEVTVTARKLFVERKAGKTTLNVENDIVSGGGTVIDLLKKAPDVTVDQDGNIQLRGKPSVNILLDGKPTYLSSDQIAKILKNMPSSSVSKIEIITQPGAQYDAAGNAGIINISTKKSKKKGANGTATLGFGHGNFPRYNGSFDFNINKGKFNYFGNYGFTDIKEPWSLLLKKIVTFQSNYTFFDLTSRFDEATTNHFYKAGVDFSITPRQILGVMVSGNINHLTGFGHTVTKYETKNMTVDTLLNTLTSYPGKYYTTNYNLNYQNTLDTNGQEIQATADYAKFTNHDFNFVTSTFFSPEGVPLGLATIFRNILPSNVDIRAAKLDYTVFIKKTLKLDVGIKASRVVSSNLTVLDSLKNGVFINDPSQTDAFKYTETIEAAYVNLNRKFKSTEIQFGLRLEQTKSDGLSVASATTEKKRRYFDYFPSVSVNQRLNKDHELTLAYSKRIDRPSYSDLNPFKFYLDQSSYSSGNPFLRPQYTASFELDHTFKGKTLTSITFSDTRDLELPVVTTNAITRISTRMPSNITHFYSTSFSFSTPLQPFPWWSLLPNLGINYNKYAADSSTTGVAVINGKIGYNISLNSSVNLPAHIKGEIQGFFHSPFVYGFNVTKAQYVVSAGVKKSFFSDQMNIKFNVADIFNIDQFAGHAVYGTTNRNFIRKPETRVANLSISYHFGGKLAKRNASSSSDDEQNRAAKK